jgi:hypothetical protein
MQRCDAGLNELFSKRMSSHSKIYARAYLFDKLFLLALTKYSKGGIARTFETGERMYDTP